MAANLNKEFFGFNLSSLPDPQQFDKGQVWSIEGLRVLRLFPVIGRRDILRILFDHFDAGGGVWGALRLLRLRKLGKRQRRCVVSYVARLARIRQMRRRLIGQDLTMEKLRKVLRSVFCSTSNLQPLKAQTITLPTELMQSLMLLVDRRMVDSIGVEMNNNIPYPTDHNVTIKLTLFGLKWVETGELQ